MTIDEKIEYLNRRLDSLKAGIIVALENDFEAAIKFAQQHKVASILLLGNGPGMYMPGIYTSVIELLQKQQVDSVRETERVLQNLTLPAQQLALKIKAFGLNIENCNKPNPVIPKPYLQRKFHIVPGSRQDKYSRSKK